MLSVVGISAWLLAITESNGTLHARAVSCGSRPSSHEADAEFRGFPAPASCLWAVPGRFHPGHAVIGAVINICRVSELTSRHVSRVVSTLMLGGVAVGDAAFFLAPLNGARAENR